MIKINVLSSVRFGEVECINGPNNDYNNIIKSQNGFVRVYINILESVFEFYLTEL